MQALAEAIQVLREGVAVTPDGHPDRAIYLNSFWSALRVLFERTGDMQALAEAIQVGRDAVAAAPDGYPDRAADLSDLGHALLARFERTGTWRR